MGNILSVFSFSLCVSVMVRKNDPPIQFQACLEKRKTKQKEAETKREPIRKPKKKREMTTTPPTPPTTTVNPSPPIQSPNSRKPTATLTAELQHQLERQAHETVWREVEGKSVMCKKYQGTSFTELSNVPPILGMPTFTPQFFSMAEIALHAKQGDVWIAIDGKVYDLSGYTGSHPGGAGPMLAMAGRDATDAFHNYHPAPVYKMLKNFYVGEVQEDPNENEKTSKFVKGHRALRQKFLEEGLFETHFSYYVGQVTWYFCLLATALYLTLTGTSAISRLFGACVMACFFQQLAFFGHDLGHNAVTHIRKVDSLIGVVFGPLLSGISLSWWKHTHNVHHVACNSVDIDPDIQHLPVMAVCIQMLHHFRETNKPHYIIDTITRWLVSSQNYTFYPIMFVVARYNLYIQSLLLLFRYPKVPLRGLEISATVIYFVWFGLLLSTLPTPTERVLYVVISHCVSGILHIQIALSHFAMPTYRGQAYNDDSDEWFRMQLRTTQNIDCSPWMDWFHGGLQFQIEHHLWPRMPRHNLRKVRKVCKQFCKEHGVQYNELSFFEAVKGLKKHMDDVATEYRETFATPSQACN